MPHITLEHSTNIVEKNNLIDLLSQINHFLHENLPTELNFCKGRAVAQHSICLGDGDPKNAFVHLNLKVLPGRTPEKLNEVGNGIINILAEYFQQSAQQLNLQITLEIEELQNYFKWKLK
jgi:5-carboxymethyl-2-hydroxymuconate isomerase